MKIDRRCFLSLGVGAAAGTALTPLPWKLTDDSSIWTQMWPWTPVPPDGAVSYVDTVSTLCPSGCGVTVKKVDDRAVKIEGREGYPGSEGNACPLCMSGIQLLYGPTAIQTPLKRVGKRGEGKWMPISWNAAIGAVAEELKKLRKAGTPQALGCIVDKEFGTVSGLFKRFLDAYGSPNFMRAPSFEDGYALALKMMHGVDALPAFDVENADFILSFGSGIIEGWGASVRMIKAHSGMKDKKGKIVQVDSRLSNTAAKADQWVAVEPGSETVLALGIAHIMIKESLYNKDFVEAQCFGFEKWKDAEGKERKGFKDVILESFPPSYVARGTGLEEAEIAKLAKAFASAKKPLAVGGRGDGSAPGAVHDYIAVHALNALAGNIHQEGGAWAIPKPDYIQWEAPKTDDTAKKGLESARADGAGTEKYPLAGQLLTRLSSVINDAEDSPVQALLVAGANPCYTLPDAKAVRSAFARIPFIVSFASHMDETAMMADIILPNHSHLERMEDVPSSRGLTRPVLGLAKPVTAPLRQSRHVGDALIALAAEMGGTIAESFPWGNYEECLEKALGDLWGPLNEKGFLADERKPAPLAEAFATPSRKLTFMSEACPKSAEGTKMADIEIEGDDRTFPLKLVPFDSLRIAAGTVGSTPFLVKIIPDQTLKGLETVVEIHPETADRYGLCGGASATLTTPKGSAEVKVHVSKGVRPGMVSIARGMGHQCPDEYLAGKGVNVNELIGPVEDPVSGMNAAWGVRASLKKA